MSTGGPFCIHQENKFDNFIRALQKHGLVNLRSHSDLGHSLDILDPATLLELFKYVFLTYATPNELNLIDICQETGMFKVAGKYLNICITPQISDKAKSLYNDLITSEGDKVSDYAFNALVAIYLGSINPLRAIYPNTYIVDLGKKTHEIDILALSSTESGAKCIMIETTRGFDIERDGSNESYSWHFKKALFKKWMIEKIYNIPCSLGYITLKKIIDNHIVQSDLPIELAEEVRANNQTPLWEKLRQTESDNVIIIDLSNYLCNPLNIDQIGEVLNRELIANLPMLFTHHQKAPSAQVQSEKPLQSCVENLSN
jgi:hypothetical protein